MSADNGIYILETSDGFRVTHAQCIENIYWWSTCCSDPRLSEEINDDLFYHERCSSCGTLDPEFERREAINPRQVYDYFHDSDVYFTIEAAMQEADRLYLEITNDDCCGIVEYGIQMIHGLENEVFPNRGIMNCCSNPEYIPFDNDQLCVNCGKPAKRKRENHEQ